jgi:hypothetical protein
MVTLRSIDMPPWVLNLVAALLHDAMIRLTIKIFQIGGKGPNREIHPINREIHLPQPGKYSLHNLNREIN